MRMMGYRVIQWMVWSEWSQLEGWRLSHIPEDRLWRQQDGADDRDEDSEHHSREEATDEKREEDVQPSGVQCERGERD